MSKNATTIKTLRKNFITRHQLNDDFFTLPDHQENNFFDDGSIFNPKRSLTNNKITSPGLSQTKVINHRYNASHPDLPSYPKKTLKPEYNYPVVQMKTLQFQPSQVKTDILKKRSMSARGLTQVPKYVAFLMKPCKVQTIQMAKRPKTALFQNKKRQTQAQKCLERKSQFNVKPMKKEDMVLPWQTQLQDFLTRQ